MKNIKFTISNIAFQKNNLHQIINLFKKNDINILEFAPSILLNNNFTKKNIFKIKKFWNKKNIKLYSMQSILYGLDNAYLFGTKNQKTKFLNEVKKKIIIAKHLGVKIIVFGSPKNKANIFNKSVKKLDAEAISIFKKINIICKTKKIIFCLEANPKIYKCEYLNYTNHAFKIAKAINSDFFKVNLDVGTIIQNKENPINLIKNNIKLIGHCQLSMPLLKPINLKNEIIKTVIILLKKHKYKGAVSMEMLPTKNNYTLLQKNVKILKNIIKI